MAGLLGIVLVMGLFSLGQFLFSDRLALYSMGATVVEEDEKLWITVDHGDQPEFVYGVELKFYKGDGYPGTAADEDVGYARAEVFLREGGQHYDVFGYTKAQLIRDLLRQYERHRQWIHHLVNVN